MAHYNKIPSNIETRVIEAAKRGTQPALIFREMGDQVPLSAIYMILTRARRRGEDIPRFAPRPLNSNAGSIFRISVSIAEHRERLVVAAAKRGLTRSQVLNRIVTIALHEKLVDSILDDGVVTDA